MSKKVKWILISTALLLVVLLGLSKAGVFGKDEGIKVVAEKVQKRTIIETVSASGKIYPEIEVKVTPEISGKIIELNVEEGDTVKKGQILARIDAEAAQIQRNQAASGVVQSQAQVANSQAALNALLAQVEQAQKNYDRQKKLFDDKVISRSEFDVVDAALKTARANYDAATKGIRGTEAGVQSARANLARANKDLGRTVLIAPENGVISLLNIKEGEGVAGNTFNVGTEIMRIADMDKIEVQVDVPENDIVKVKLGDTAIVDVEAYTERKFKGVVTKIASSNTGAALQSSLTSTNNDVTQYKVHVRLIADSYSDLIGHGRFPFKPGMRATANIQTQKKVDVISVPVKAVTTREKNDSVDVKKMKMDETNYEQTATTGADDLDVVVFTIEKDGTVKKVKVKTGIQDINNIEITEGLKEGEEIVTDPYDIVNKTLKEKDKVKVIAKKDLYSKPK